MIGRLAIIGLGLIGGSLARALRQQEACGEIVGCGRRREPLERAVQTGVIDRCATDPSEVVRGADMVVIAVPLGAMRPVMKALAPALDAEAVVTDAGSAKRCVLRDAEAVMGEHLPRFVPGHPVAGTERSGVEASFAELFENRRVILTPGGRTEPAATARVRRMWEATGAQIVEMDAGHHDEVLAATSHLPHVLSYGLVDTLARMDERSEIFDLAAGGFRDFTRIASSDPAMWRDICLANADQLLAVLDRYTADLSDLRKAIAKGDGDGLTRVFERAKRARDAWVER